jgi:ribonuclease HII
MSLSKQSREKLLDAILSIADNLSKAENTMVTDLYFQVDMSNGVLTIYDDDDNTMAQATIDEWKVTEQSEERSSVEKTLRSELAQMQKVGLFDKINILNASILAMHRAVDGLKVRPEALIIDGNRFKPYQDLPHTTVVKGDGKYLSIAAASILAKTYRDDYMNKLHEEFPHYDWKGNKGYPTKKHREGIRLHGTTPYHRMSFNLLGDGQLKLDF